MRLRYPAIAFFLTYWAGAGPPACLAAEVPPAAEQIRFFEAKVRPVLAANCFKCHGPQKQRNELRLDSRAALLRGGESGPAIVPGKPEKSLLIDAINHRSLEMPPTGKLQVAEVAALTAWVKMGAPWPTSEGPSLVGDKVRGKITASDRAFWSFQPVRMPPVPIIKDGGWSTNPLDRFLWQKLQAEGLTPAPEADRGTLIRRVYFDLLGLPPTPQEIDAFLADKAPDAYEKLIDRLLASPRYGERWARHWLDLVRYAESDGFKGDDYRPSAWRYRDYVIEAFNKDKPYDRFVQEQLAGDELFPDDPQARIATGFLRHWIYEYNNRDVRGQWATILNDVTDTTSDVFLGLGLQCARCHDHKFDPILQKDYYRLQAFFAPLVPRDDLTVATQAQVTEYRIQLAVWEARTAEVRQQIAALEEPFRKKATREAIKRFPADIQKVMLEPADRRTPLEQQLADLGQRQLDYDYAHLDARIKGPDKARLLALRKQLARFDQEKPRPLPGVLAVADLGPQAPPVFIPGKNSGPIDPGFLTILEEGAASIEPVGTAPQSTGRRTALARWLTRPENPLTTRVIVNRVWQYHFGRGLAANASDLGRLGEPPTHPALLDWLAGQFVQDGWSFKKLHRLILTSAAYRQSTRNPGARQYRLKDPDNRFLWRGNTRRLDAEQIRDAILAVTGELDLTAGGPSALLTQPRRTIYTRVYRNTRDPLLDAFDLPWFITSVPSRDTTTTPVQSLLLLNSQIMLQRAQAFARRLEEAPDEPSRVRRAYRLSYGRAPEAEENAAALRFLREQTQRLALAKTNAARAGSVKGKDFPRLALVDFCHMLLNSSEFLYVD